MPFHQSARDMETAERKFKPLRPGLHECAVCRWPWADHAWDGRCPVEDRPVEASTIDQGNPDERDAEIQRLRAENHQLVDEVNRLRSLVPCPDGHDRGHL